MTREIRSQRDIELRDTGNQPNMFNERLLKLIPAEIVTLYVTICGLINGVDPGPGDKPKLLWIIIATMVILTPIYLAKITHVAKKEQILFTTIGFVIWVFATGSPMPTLLGYPAEFIASIVLMLYTLFIPLFYKG